MSTMDHAREFHEHFNVPIRTGEPTTEIGEARLAMRMNLIAEEFAELVEAVYGTTARRYIDIGYATAMLMRPKPHTGDVIATADALADLDYVMTGLALELGIPHDAVVAEVHHSNMTKSPAPGKMVKGPGYSPPDIKTVLGL